MVAPISNEQIWAGNGGFDFEFGGKAWVFRKVIRTTKSINETQISHTSTTDFCEKIGVI